jgi:hypothetical protein
MRRSPEILLASTGMWILSTNWVGPFPGALSARLAINNAFFYDILSFSSRLEDLTAGYFSPLIDLCNPSFCLA